MVATASRFTGLGNHRWVKLYEHPQQNRSALKSLLAPGDSNRDITVYALVNWISIRSDYGFIASLKM